MNPLDDTRTKVVCTMGPASWGAETLREMVLAGMDVARINLAHGRHEEHARTIAKVRHAAREESSNVAIMADLQGPKHRIGRLADGTKMLSQGDEVVLLLGVEAGSAAEIPVLDPAPLAHLRAGSTILLGDGTVMLEALEATSEQIRCVVAHGGRITSHQGIRAVQRGGSPRLAALSDKDREDLTFALEQGVDIVALSFVGCADDVVSLRRLIASKAPGDGSPAVLAKIERQSAVDELDAILGAADAVMVARGDLGIEIAPERVPFCQKEIIAHSRRAAVPVITATQMLLSMVDHPQPTRAEASDVANAVLDGTDAVMLSEETAIGKHPVDAVRMMGRIVRIAEDRCTGTDDMSRSPGPPTTTDAVSDAAAALADELGVKLIAAATHSGYTARRVARARPRAPILALTPDARIARRLALTWGVHPLHVPGYETVEEMIDVVRSSLHTAGLVEPGDTILITGGYPFGEGQSNLLKVQQM
ncbi:MAG: pyruvate kinase [Candidatus Bipolaricaulota bacterium]|nr:MAG: pyruvate kinase [Candidatus Bipolaricaulota bacterium]